MKKDKELILNLYYAYATLDGLTTIIGLHCKTHSIGGSEASKLKFLQDNVVKDFPQSVKVALSKRYHVLYGNEELFGVLPLASFNSMAFNYKLDVFEEVFAKVQAEQGVKIPLSPLVCITGIKLEVDEDGISTGKHEVVINEVIHV